MLHKIEKIEPEETFIKAGLIMTAPELGLVLKGPQQSNPAQPILYADVHASQWKLLKQEGMMANAGKPDTCYSHIGYGAIDVSDGRMTHVHVLTFRFQLGAKLVYWLADAADPEIWQMLESWAKARYMTVGLRYGNDLLVLSRDFPGIPLQLQATRRNPGDIDKRFVMGQAGLLITSGILKRQATSDLPHVRNLLHIDAFVVRTQRSEAAFSELSIANKSTALGSEFGEETTVN